MTTYWICLVKF